MLTHMDEYAGSVRIKFTDLRSSETFDYSQSFHPMWVTYLTFPRGNNTNHIAYDWGFIATRRSIFAYKAFKLED